jgi:hypothetical protein
LKAGVGTANEAGRFVLRGLEPGDYVLEARHDDWASVRSKVVTLAEDKPARAVQLILQRGLVITGQVLLPEGGKGSGITVTLRGQDKQLMQRTDAGGRFRFQGLTRGAYTLRAYLGRSTASTPLTVRLAGADETVTIDAWQNRDPSR